MFTALLLQLSKLNSSKWTVDYSTNKGGICRFI